MFDLNFFFHTKSSLSRNDLIFVHNLLNKNESRTLIFASNQKIDTTSFFLLNSIISAVNVEFFGTLMSTFHIYFKYFTFVASIEFFIFHKLSFFVKKSHLQHFPHGDFILFLNNAISILLPYFFFFKNKTIL